jgi:hypothetical protein
MADVDPPETGVQNRTTTNTRYKKECVECVERPCPGGWMMDPKERDEVETALARLREARERPGTKRPTASIHTLPMPASRIPLSPALTPEVIRRIREDPWPAATPELVALLRSKGLSK